MLESFWPAFVVSAILAWPMLALMRRIKADALISQYTPEHAGKAGTPSMGGIAPILGMLVGLAWHRPDEQAWWAAAFVAIIGYALIGFADDFLVPRAFPGKRGLGWPQKLVAQFAIAGLTAWMLQPQTIWHGVGYGFVVVFFANAVNFSDGLDGLCAGLLCVASFGLLVFSIASDVGTLALMTIGALVPFLFLNAPPAKIFMGDVGALPFGAVFGIMLIVAQSGRMLTTDKVMFVFISLVFILELILVPMQLFAVKVFKRRIFPATPLHHTFEKLGWKETRITATFLLVQALLVFVAWTWAEVL